MKPFCGDCGADIDGTARFCVRCGAEIMQEGSRPQGPIPAASATDQPPRTSGLIIGADGTYRWYSEINLFSDPTVFIALCKVLGGVVLGCGLLIGLLSQQDFADTVGLILTIWGFGIGGALVFGGLAYVLYAALQGGRYCVVFEMDEQAVTHTQIAKQFEKAQVAAALTVLAGAAKGSPTLMGTGLLAGSRDSMKTVFKEVRAIKANRRRHVVYLKQGFSWNHIYVPSEDFDAVLDYLLSRIPKDVRREGM